MSWNIVQGSGKANHLERERLGVWLSDRQYFATAGVLGMNRDFVRFNLKKKIVLTRLRNLIRRRKVSQRTISVIRTKQRYGLGLWLSRFVEVGKGEKELLTILNFESSGLKYYGALGSNRKI